MKKHFRPSSWGSHTWNDLGGPVGLILDAGFFAIVLISAFFMIIFSGLLVVLDYLVSPILRLLSRIKTKPAA